MAQRTKKNGALSRLSAYLGRGGKLRLVFSTFALRGMALGGRFVFVIFAAHNMRADSFGRFGLVQALALIVSGVVGCEAYQVLLRRIQNAPDSEAAILRRTYGSFAFAAASAAVMFAGISLWAMGWTGIPLLLGMAIVGGEHLNTEIYRNLVNQHRPEAAVFNVSLRTGAWGLLITFLDFAHFLERPWTLEMVLTFWIGGIFLGFLTGAPLWSSFRPYVTFPSIGLKAIISDVGRRSGPWIVTIVAWRIIENGGRFVATWEISEAATGRLTLLSMLASLSFVAQRGIVEPIYFPKLIVPGQRRAERDYFLACVACIIGGAIAALLAWATTLVMNHNWPTIADTTVMLLLLGTYSLLVISQLPHYALYRQHRDSAIARATVIGAIVMAASTFPLTAKWGLSGVAGSMLLGSMAMTILKWLSSRRIRA